MLKENFLDQYLNIILNEKQKKKHFRFSLSNIVFRRNRDSLLVHQNLWVKVLLEPKWITPATAERLRNCPLESFDDVKTEILKRLEKLGLKDEFVQEVVKRGFIPKPSEPNLGDLAKVFIRFIVVGLITVLVIRILMAIISAYIP